MIRLNDYFDPVNGRVLLILILVWLVLDGLGVLFRHVVMRNKDESYRILDWLIGLGLFVALWFVVGFFIPPHRTAVWGSVCLLLVLVLPYYIKIGALFSLLRQFCSHWVAIVMLLAFAPAVFVKASLPPYYGDEMAYHFISPWAVMNVSTWNYLDINNSPGIYGAIPKLFDTFFLLMFSMSKTHVISRLCHFLIFSTGVVYVSGRLRRDFGWVAGILFGLGVLSIPQYLIFYSTLGFVDIANCTFLLMAMFLGVLFVAKNDIDDLYLSVVFWAMALGTKYSGLSSFLSFLTVLVVASLIKKNCGRILWKWTVIVKLVLIFVLFGGYWYVKNLIMTGNPVFPFFLPCYRWAQECGSGSSYFGIWTDKVTWLNVPNIYLAMFAGKKVYGVMLLLSLVLLFLIRKAKEIRIVGWALVFAIGMEFVILSKTAGFYPRYHQHLQFELLLMASVILPVAVGGRWIRLLLKCGIVIICVVLLVNYREHVQDTYRKGEAWRMTQEEVLYAKAKMDIYQWVEYRFPKRSGFIRWCEQQAGVKVVRVDPDLIWYDDAMYLHQYLTNCHYGGPGFSWEGDEKTVLVRAVEKKARFVMVTINPCLPSEKVVKKLPYEDENALGMRKLNNVLVCHSKMVGPDVYEFDYQNLKI